MADTESTKFSWDGVHARRREIALGVQKRLKLSISLAVEKPFAALDLTDQNLADQPMWCVPFYVIAQLMIAETDHHHIIDHAWWLIAQDRSDEPWGFVTEPYIETARAQRLAESVQGRIKGWGVEIRALPQAESAWLPGSTVPIITTATSGCLPEFLRLGIGAALAALKCGYVR